MSRMGTAWKLANYGLFYAAIEELLFGFHGDDTDIAIQNPTQTWDEFDHILRDLNLISFSSHLQPNATLRYPLTEHERGDVLTKSFIQIVTYPKAPVMMVSVITRFTDLNVTVKHNPETNLWQVDDACITLHSQSLDGDSVIYSIPCDKHQNGDHFLPAYLEAFRASVGPVMASAPDAETDIYKRVKPILDEISVLEEVSRRAEIRQPGTGGPSKHHV